MDPIDNIRPPHRLLSLLKPPGDMVVHELLRTASPCHSDCYASVPVQGWFSAHEPNAIPIALDDVILPPARICVQLEEHLREAVGRGSRSVMHPTKPGLWTPLWTVRLYKWGERLLNRRHAWMQCWLWTLEAAEKEAWDRGFKIDVIEVLRRARSDDPISEFVRVHTLRLASQLLSDSWLTEETMNCLLEVIRRDAKTAGLFVAPAELCQAVQEDASHELSATWGNMLASGLVHQLLLVYNVGGSHWVAMVVDVGSSTVASGNTLLSVSDAAALDVIKSWLQHYVPQNTWKSSRGQIPVAKQIDGNSCGIGSINALHCWASPQARSWAPRHARLSRAYYFVQAMDLCGKV